MKMTIQVGEECLDTLLCPDGEVRIERWIRYRILEEYKKIDGRMRSGDPIKTDKTKQLLDISTSNFN